MSRSELITVVIPTRNRWRFLARAIEVVLGQREALLELVVVDDGSTDETVPMLGALDDPRVRTVRHERPKGLPHARNTGLSIAGGDWVSFLDDDDVWAPTKLRAQLEALRSTGGAYAYAGAFMVDARLNVREVAEPPAPRGILPLLLTQNAIPAGASNVIARRAAIQALGGFDERLPHLADWDLWIRLAAAESGTACLDTLVAYRHHPGNMVVAETRGLFDEVEYLAGKHRLLAREHGVELDRVAFARWVAWGQRRAGRRKSAAATYLRAARHERSLGDLARAAAVLFAPGVFELRKRLRGPAVPPPSWLLALVDES